MLDSAGQVLGYVASAAQVIFMATAILLLAFYWTLDGPRTIQSLLLLVPIEPAREHSANLFRPWKPRLVPTLPDKPSFA